MLNALSEPVRNTLCGQRRASAERARARPGQKPDQAAQQPRPQTTTPDAAQHNAQRRLPPGRHCQLTALGTPRSGVHKRLAPPLPPAVQRDDRNPPLAPERLHACAAAQHQCAHHHQQRRHTETPPEEARRRRRHPSPATGAAEAEAPGVLSKRRRQTVGFARVGRAVQSRPAMRTPRRAAPRRLGFVDLLEKGPHTGIGKDGAEEESVRHWESSLAIWSSPRDKASRRASMQALRGAPTPKPHLMRADPPPIPAESLRALTGCNSMMRIGAGSGAGGNPGVARRARRRSWPPWSSMMRAGR